MGALALDAGRGIDLRESLETCVAAREVGEVRDALRALVTGVHHLITVTGRALVVDNLSGEAARHAL